jgi:hypothetical protein
MIRSLRLLPEPGPLRAYALANLVNTTGSGLYLTGYTAVVAAAATLSDTALSLAFAQDLPPGARLYYGWGTGRIALPGQPGEGAAIYDRNGLPMFAPADGIPIR